MQNSERHLVIGVNPFNQPNPQLTAAVERAGCLGVLDPGFDRGRALEALADAARWAPSTFGVRVSPGCPLDVRDLPDEVDTIILGCGTGWAGQEPSGRLVLTEISSLDEALEAVRLGADGLIAKGAEAGGRVGDTSTFVLIQQLLAELDVPVWAAGGIGLHTAAAAVAGGCRGVVLDSQLALVREAELPRQTATAIAMMDGSETVLVDGHRVYTRPDLPPRAGPVAGRLGADLVNQFLPVGQDAAFAKMLAERYVTAGGVVSAIRSSILDHMQAAVDHKALTQRDALGAGIDRPIAQGAMTRVSDRAEFAKAVSQQGGLPFLALALMRGEQVTELLRETAELLGHLPWGVGILGFTPAEIRDAQLEAIKAAKPPYALIAGGRPSQAALLEAAGIATYLHVPSPGLLDRFLKEGARRFVFEGFECGGHVGPRSSFALWETQIERLLTFGSRHPESFGDMRLLFAGGIHDERSAAMVAAAAAPLVERGASIGVLLGTAYLFTEEAVNSGAILPVFQQQAVRCERTVLLETSPGHATRCVPNHYAEAFEQSKRDLAEAGTSTKDMWIKLEKLNLGRLRLASKGLVREGDAFRSVDQETQERDGMFMLGQVASLRNAITNIGSLHEQVTSGATEFLVRRAQTVLGKEQQPAAEPNPVDVAIVGMSCVFPQAKDLGAYWTNIVGGVDAISEVSPERWDANQYYDPDAFKDPQGRTPSKWGGFLPEVPFDPLAYGIPPASLVAIEPVQLLALKVAAEALKDAGYASRPFNRQRTSVIFGAEAGTDLANAYGFRGTFPSFYGELPSALDEHLPSLTEDSFAGVLANVIAGRIANRLNLGGLNYTVDAACAASLAALDIACKELSTGSSDMVLCGGADLHNGIQDYLLFSSVHALSPSGRCATFDSSADGISLGEGVACVVLKRLADAERDGDRIYAIVKAVGGSSDGKSLGLTAPRAEGQQLALTRAYEQAGVSPREVGLIEAHGTGTVVGDRTELGALTSIFSEAGAAPGSCALGSVKSQIGHTKCTAGLAGLIKAALSIYTGVRPGTLHISDPNPAWEPEKSPFFFSSSPVPWSQRRGERFAGVSAFGFGGTNFHAVLADYDGEPPPAHGLTEWPAELFVFRGTDIESYEKEVAYLHNLIEANDRAGRPWALRDLAYTMAARPSTAPVRTALVAERLDDLSVKLQSLASSTPASGIFFSDAAFEPGKVAFLFPGQGSQRPGMLGELLVAFPQLQRILPTGHQFAPVMFPPAAFSREERTAQRAALTDTRVAQPALGIAGLVMNELLHRVGLKPDMVGGHSYGELVALAAAGAFGQEDLLRLSVARAEAILGATEDDSGTMTAVSGPIEAVRNILEGFPQVVMANHNSPTQSVISGPTPSIQEVETLLERQGLRFKRLEVACAFHSPIVAGAVEAFSSTLTGVDLNEPSLPVWSNLTARPFDADIRSTMARQLGEPVLFAEQIESMYEAGARVFVEAGPGRVLTNLISTTLGDRPHRAVACDVSGENGLHRLLLAIAELVASGLMLDLEPLYAGRAQIASPTEVPQPAGWKVNGHLVRLRNGDLIPGGLRPANDFPRQQLQVGGLPVAPSSRDAAVLQFISSTREMIAAQRDVLLTYLGGAAPVRIHVPPAESVVREPLASIEAMSTLTTGAGDNGSPEAPADLGEILLDIIGQRTGYPRDMLDPNLDLEADLSIDSIKRAEILGELADRLGLSAAGRTLDEDKMSELAQIKTIEGIVDWLRTHLENMEDGAAAPDVEAPAQPEPVAEVKRLVPEVQVIDLSPPPNGRVRFDGKRCVIVDDERGISLALANLLEQRGADTRITSDPDELRDADFVVQLAALRPGGQLVLPGAFAGIRRALLEGAEALVMATGSAGTFGLGWTGDGTTDPRSGAGLRGLARAIALEYPQVRVRAVDVDLKEEPEKVATRLLAEICDPESPVVVGYTNGSRTTLRYVEVPLETSASVALGPQSVVLVTGGARGITARAALALARSTGCHIELAGRTPEPAEAENPLTSAAPDEVALRLLLVAHGARTLPEVEATVKGIMADREIRANLGEIGRYAASIRYNSVDVRNERAVAGLVDAIYRRHGRLDGVVHGAGVTADKLLRDKTPESFASVFETKVRGAEAIARSVRPPLSFFVSFGSISGTFGNRGQSDYAAANDALDTLSWVWNHRLDVSRVVSIDWGPWAASSGGMVSEELEREYARRGITTIAPELGLSALMKELAEGPSSPAQVIYTTVQGF